MDRVNAQREESRGGNIRTLVQGAAPEESFSVGLRINPTIMKGRLESAVPFGRPLEQQR